MRRDKTDEYELRLDVGETKARLPFSDTIERLIRERDQARAKLEATEAALYQAHEQKHWHHEQGYRKGVEDAADAVELHETNWKVGTSENKAEIRAAIIALLEQTEPGEKK